MYLLPISRIYVSLFALLAGMLLFASCDKNTTPNTPHKLTLNSEPKAGGSVEHYPDQASFKEGDSVSISPIVNEGYEFTGWTGDVPKGKENASILNLTMDAAKTITATFGKKMEIPTYTLTLTPPTNGKVEGHQASYKKDELTDIKATAAEGYYFSHWTGDVPKAQEKEIHLKLKMTANLSLGVVFAQKKAGITHKLTLTAPVNGAVSGDKATYTDGEMSDLTAKPAGGYAFSHWTGVSDGKKSDNPLKIAMTKDLTLAAVFVETYDLTLTITPTAGGTIAKSPDQTTFKSGDTVSLTPSPAAGYEFAGWTGDVPKGKEKANPLKLTMDAAKTVAATFAKKTYTLTLNATHGSVTQSVNNQGDSVLLTAIADKGYGFNGWSGHNIPKGKEKANPLVIGVTSNTTITAHFQTPIYLDANGVTLKAASFTKVGETHTYNGKTYTIADKAMLVAAAKASGDMTQYITTKVTDMSELFKGRASFNQDISAWDVSSVTDMTGMFSGANAFNQDIGAWDVGQVTSMESMFLVAVAFDQNIGGWDVSKVIYMDFMFGGASAFNQDIGKWKVGKVTTMRSMFDNATAFNGDISGWDVSSVTDMKSMFNLGRAFNQDISGWDVSKVTNMEYMFDRASQFDQDLSRWCVQQVKTRGNFDLQADAWKRPKPVWGSCPK